MSEELTEDKKAGFHNAEAAKWYTKGAFDCLRCLSPMWKNDCIPSASEINIIAACVNSAECELRKARECIAKIKNLSAVDF